jgi:hypothetical protein
MIDIERTLRLLDVEAESHFVQAEAIDAINYLLRENARLQGLLREAHVKMEANNLWSNLRHRVAAAIREGAENA